MLDRRKFLTHSCHLGLATTTLGSSLMQLGLARNVAAQSAPLIDDYKALVCILLAGGNDSYNMLVPTDGEDYAGYADIRSDLALPRESLLALSGTDDSGRSFGIHPGMPGMQARFASGEVALLRSVGTLVEPMDTASLIAQTAKLPLGLYSHSDQIQQWQSAISDARSAQGWAGRIADLLEEGNPSNGISMNISLVGNNVFQSGSLSTAYAISSSGNGAPELAAYHRGGENGGLLRTAIDGLLSTEHKQLLRREYGSRLQSAIESQATFDAALALAPPLPGEFSESPFSAAMQQIARVISVRGALGASRQTFFVTVGGWDHHDELIDSQAAMLPAIDAGLNEFQNAISNMGMGEQVTSFTISDFGRTLTSNGRGSDHGWSGHHIVMGGAVNGGAFYGNYPEIFAGNPLDVGRGVYAPTTSVDEYFGELALWFGVAPNELESVLPNAHRFFDPVSTSRPMGFMR